MSTPGTLYEQVKTQTSVYCTIKHICLSRTKNTDWGPVHTYPFSFENATFSLRIRLPSTRIRWKRSMKTELFENAVFACTWGQTKTTLRSHSKFQSTPRNIRNLFKVSCPLTRMGQACAVGQVVVFKSIHRKCVDERKRCENAMSVRADIFDNGEKKNCVFKPIRIHADRAWV